MCFKPPGTTASNHITGISSGDAPLSLITGDGLSAGMLRSSVNDSEYGYPGFASIRSLAGRSS